MTLSLKRQNAGLSTLGTIVVVVVVVLVIAYLFFGLRF